MEIKNPLKNPFFFSCKKCDYNTSSSKDYRKHCLTLKHKNGKNGNEMEMKKSPYFECSCSKKYKSYSGLWKHQKKCISNNPLKKEENYQPLSPEIVMKFIEQNKELTNIVIEQNKTITKLNEKTVEVTNNTQINNTLYNKSFNLNFYLNETCKNAINIDEFIDNINLSLDDLEFTGKSGYIEGISNIILRNLKNLRENDRPIHCSDFKREILYIKQNNMWNKEENKKPILTNVINDISNENIKQINKWKEEYPDCINPNSKLNNIYLKIVNNSISGFDQEEHTKNVNKIISKLVRGVTIQKNRIEN